MAKARILGRAAEALGMERVPEEPEEESVEYQDTIYGNAQASGREKSRDKKASRNLDPWPKEDTSAQEFVDPQARRPKVAVMNLHIVEPDSFDQVRQAADLLREKKAIIINLEEVEYEDARKIIDFMSGNIYALGGTVHKISAGIILFAPDTLGVEVLRKGGSRREEFPPVLERDRDGDVTPGHDDD